MSIIMREAAPRAGDIKLFRISSRFLRIAKTLYLLVFTQFRTESHFALCWNCSKLLAKGTSRPFLSSVDGTDLDIRSEFAVAQSG